MTFKNIHSHIEGYDLVGGVAEYLELWSVPQEVGGLPQCDEEPRRQIWAVIGMCLMADLVFEKLHELREPTR